MNRQANAALAILHGYAALLFSVGTAMLLVVCAMRGDSPLYMTAYAVYGGFTILYFCMSAAYHLLSMNGRRDSVLRGFDRCFLALLRISALLPISLIVFGGTWGWFLLGLSALYAVTCIADAFRERVLFVGGSRVSFLLMLILAVVVVLPLAHIFPATGMFWLYSGAVCNLVGGMAEVGLIPVSFKGFGSHELAHVLILFGAACHQVMIYNYIL